MASLDAENLYTNVPVEETIQIILNNVYRNSQIPPPKISENTLKQMLTICTTEAPFMHIDGTIYVQRDGLAMGGPLSCTMANFYMAHVENQVLENSAIKPRIYCRFIDDIFVLVRDEDHLIILETEFKSKSALNFTHEVAIGNKIPFLDVLLDNSNDKKLITSVYTKPTKSEDCLNYNSAAPERYKTGVIKTLISRAWKISSDHDSFNQEKLRIKKLLVNNNFPCHVCDRAIDEFVRNKQRHPNTIDTEGVTTGDSQDQSIQNCGGMISRSDTAIPLEISTSIRAEINSSIRPADPPHSNGDGVRASDQSSTGVGALNIDSDSAVPTVKIFYRNQFSPRYREDELAINKIIKNNVFQVSCKINLLIYYKSRKTCNLIMKNNISAQTLPNINRSHLVYKFTCNESECMSLNFKNSYIGYTTQTLQDRLKGHRYAGSIFAHYFSAHGDRPTLQGLVNNTEIMYSCDDPIRLRIFEAILIRKFKPLINENLDDFACNKLRFF